MGGLVHYITILVADNNGHVGYGTVGLDGYIVIIVSHVRDNIRMSFCYIRTMVYYDNILLSKC